MNDLNPEEKAVEVKNMHFPARSLNVFHNLKLISMYRKATQGESIKWFCKICCQLEKQNCWNCCEIWDTKTHVIKKTVSASTAHWLPWYVDIFFHIKLAKKCLWFEDKKANFGRRKSAFWCTLPSKVTGFQVLNC